MRARPFFRLGWLLALLLLVACERRLIYLETPPPGGNGQASPTAERSAVLQDIVGQVETRSSSAATWRTSTLQQALIQGAELRSGTGSSAMLQLTEGSKIRVGAETTLVLSLFNPYLDSQLTSLTLETGQVWALLNGGALDVETPLGTATARGAYLHTSYNARTRVLNVMCLQGLCGFGTVLIPPGYKLVDAARNTSPEPMGIADYGDWGLNVPEATQLAYLATEAVAQGNATLPVVSTPTPSHTPIPLTPTPSATVVIFQPTVTPRPFTPIPTARVLGQHAVRPGETIFCLGRGYGVLPGAIAQANNLALPYTIYAGQTLKIPAIQWFNISPGPVCPTQFVSPYPGLPAPTATAPASASPTPPFSLLSLVIDVQCTLNCGSREGSYTLHITANASGGVQPYTFVPGRVFDVTFQHCVDGTGNVTVSSADGQTATLPWYYRDVSCVPTDTAGPPTEVPPTPIPTETPSPQPSPTDTTAPPTTAAPSDTPQATDTSTP